MIVKVEWTDHERKYTIGIRQFLQHAGIEMSDEEIKIILRKLLSNDGLQSIE